MVCEPTLSIFRLMDETSPLPGINLNRNPTGQSDPYYKLIQAIPPTWWSKTSSPPFDLFFKTPTKNPKEYFLERRRRDRRGKWEGKEKREGRGERKREKRGKGKRPCLKGKKFLFFKSQDDLESPLI